jgi:arsenite-transporting ATPase
LDAVLAEELAVLPGMEEVSLLLHINRYVRRQEFDVLLLDCAPTGESLRFISIPTTLEWYMKKLFKLERTIARYAGPLAKRLYDIPLPDDTYFDAIEKLFARLEGVDQILCDPEITTVRLVTNPEKVVLNETQRAFMYFCLYKMKIDAVILNRMLPSGIADAYFGDWIKRQHRYFDLARDYFQPVPILAVDLLDREIYGYQRLSNLSDAIYGEYNPLDHFSRLEPFSFAKEDGHYRLQLQLPFVTKDQVEINRLSDELVLRIGSYKRHIALPRQIASHAVISARIEAAKLNIIFEGETCEQKKQ